MLNQRCSKHISDLRGRRAWADLEHPEQSLALHLAVGSQSCHVTSLVSAGSSVKWGCRRLNGTTCVQFSGGGRYKCQC